MDWWVGVEGRGVWGRVVGGSGDGVVVGVGVGLGGTI